MNYHVLAKCGHLFRKGSVRFGAQPVDPGLESMARGSEEPFPLLVVQLVGERDRRQLRGVQNLV